MKKNKVLYAFLNWGRDPKNINKSKIPSQKDLLVCTNNPKGFKQHINTIEAEFFVGASKNKILKYALANNYDYCFIIEDDIKVKDVSVFNKYITMMEDLDLNVSMYGYDKECNKALTKYNPILSFKVNNSKTYLVNKQTCSSVMCFKVFDGMTMFDDRLQMLETDYYMYDCCQDGNHKFLGFNFDIDESWKYFQKFDIPPIRVKDQSIQKFDFETRNMQKIFMSNNADEVLEYVYGKIEKQII